MEFLHRPVLLNEAVDGLNVRAGGTYVDGTLGGGGHCALVLGRLSGTGRMIGIDRDGDAIETAEARLRALPGVGSGGTQLTVVRDNYLHLPEILDSLKIECVDGILLDLGVSSWQLDNPERGFSYRADAPLDMRMDRRSDRTAADVVNQYTEEELYRVIRDYGEDRFAKNIARQIVRRREKHPIATTGELAETVGTAIPMKVRATGGHPAKRTFQAIRIEVNRELEVLEQSVDRMIGRLAPGGRLCVITFHSLEDRIVKTKFRENESPCICPPDFPVCVCGRKSKGKVITRKPILPGEEETRSNPRAQSAKLRIFERGQEETNSQVGEG